MPTFFQGFFGLFSRKNRRSASQDAIRKRTLESYQNVEWIPLSEAAQLMYDELDGTVWRTAADREPTHDARLDYMATHLVHNAPCEGRSPPSTSYQPVPAGEFKAGVIKGGGKYFQRYYESYLTFVDMRVRKEDLRDALKRMKARE